MGPSISGPYLKAAENLWAVLNFSHIEFLLRDQVGHVSATVVLECWQASGGGLGQVLLEEGRMCLSLQGFLYVFCGCSVCGLAGKGACPGVRLFRLVSLLRFLDV